jgi:DNA-binding beta-propeller fold protein YncE
MFRVSRAISGVAAAVAIVSISGALVFTQADVVDPASKPLPNPNPTVIKNWGTLPDGRVWGNTAGVDIGPDGHVWAYDRCGSNSCADSKADPILKFDRNSGKLLASFGGGLILFPHGIHVDRDGNVWITDGQDNGNPARGGAGRGAGDGAGRGAGGGRGAATGGGGAGADGAGAAAGGRGQAAGRGAGGAARGTATPTVNPAATRGHQVFKFSPKGDVLMTIGKAGGGVGADCCFQPNDVITNQKGEIFISEGHSGGGRIRKFSRDGKLIKTWGEPGSGPGQFNIPHALAMDSRGRLFVADRANHRIQVFDQEGTFVADWKQFSRISGLFIDRDDNLYAIDSESSEARHPGWKTGVRIGKTTEDKVLAFIPPHDNGQFNGAAGEGVAVDPDGNVYGAEGPISRQAAGGGLTKYVKGK